MEWKWNKKFQCWCLEDVLYTQKVLLSKFQRMSIFVPEVYMSAPGVIDYEGCINGYTAVTAPIVFENNSAGYRQMPHTWLGEEGCFAEPYLAHGLVYVTCGNRGSESTDQNGRYCGKAPANLIDLKTGVRFLRHHKSEIPGDMERIISVGCSAGGAMSALLAVTGNHRIYDIYLEENGAFMEERDDVYAAQCYCPVTDLEHADMAYEWMFSGDVGMSAYQFALSRKLKEEYIRYFNRLNLGVTFGADGRSGSAYEYLMKKLNDSVKVYQEKKGQSEETKKVSGLDEHVRDNCSRNKKCPAFDSFDNCSNENRLFGNSEEDYRHFNTQLAKMMISLREEFPEEYNQYYKEYEKCCTDEGIKQQMYLLNPLNFISREKECMQAEHYRIRVGTCDADTSFSISMTLALMLKQAGKDVDYEFVWNRPHCEADYPGEIQEWIDQICR